MTIRQIDCHSVIRLESGLKRGIMLSYALGGIRTFRAFPPEIIPAKRVHAMNSTRTLSIVAFAVLIVSPVVVFGEELRHEIDRRVETAWKTNHVAPAERSTDAEFLRRVYLDLLGVIPSYDEAIAFLDDTSPDKRETLIRNLLDHPRYGVHQSDVWDMVYFGRNPPNSRARVRDGFKQWLRDQFSKNVPYDVWAREILRAEGNTVEHGAPMFYVQYGESAENATEAITQKFLGIQLQCARCHDHPFDQWSQLDFYGTAAFLARLQIVDVGKKNKVSAYAIGEKSRGDVMFTGPAIDQEPGKKGEPVKPKFLGGAPLAEPGLPEDFKEDRRFSGGKIPPKPKFSRKDALADWVASSDNPYFARAIANRVWAQFMGKGIVHPVDNLSPDNPPSHPELLDVLAESLVQHKFDLKWLIGEIVNSQTYQRSSGGSATEAKPRWYEQARYRPLSAEELFESWLLASGYVQRLEASGQKSDKRFENRGITWNYLLDSFAKPNDGVGNFQGGLDEHLYLNNGQVRQLISDKSGRLLDALTKSDAPWEERVERLYVQVLSRRPTPAETEKFIAFLSTEDDPRGRLHDAIWTLMTCSEFRFCH